MNTHVVSYAAGRQNEVRDFLGLMIPDVAITYRPGGSGIWQIRSLLSAAQITDRLSRWVSSGEQLDVRQMNEAEADGLDDLEDWQYGQMTAPFASIFGLSAHRQSPPVRSSA
jgi:hypothetical protein